MTGVDAGSGGGVSPRGSSPAAGSYPAHREADIVLSDGGTALLRPIRPDDGPLLVDFYARVSEESKYFRFFAPYPTLSARDVEHFTTVDQRTRVAVIVTIGDEMIAVGRYDQTEPGEAEVAFLVQDAHQNRGLASVLLEHLAQTARENGISRFVAEVLPHNQRMLVVFRAAGYTITDSLDDGVVSLEFQIAPTDSSIDVMSAREHRAEARSVQRLLRPRSVAVVGASRFADKVGQTLLRNVVMGNFAGTVYPINPAAESVAGLPAYPDVASVPGEIDLAVIAVPIDAVAGVVRECAAKGVKGLVVVSTAAGPQGGPAPGDSVESQRELIRIARRYGMRMIGPHAFGAINTDPALRLNASLADIAPTRSRVGVFSQSGALGPVLLASLAAHDLGVSSFVAAGYRGDVSANDMLQYFGEDEDTDVVLLYLESVGNPRKFSRIARRLSLTRPVVAVRSGRTSGLQPDRTSRRRPRPPGCRRWPRTRCSPSPASCSSTPSPTWRTPPPAGVPAVADRGPDRRRRQLRGAAAAGCRRDRTLRAPAAPSRRGIASGDPTRRGCRTGWQQPWPIPTPTPCWWCSRRRSRGTRWSRPSP